MIHAVIITVSDVSYRATTARAADGSTDTHTHTHMAFVVEMMVTQEHWRLLFTSIFKLPKVLKIGKPHHSCFICMVTIPRFQRSQLISLYKGHFCYPTGCDTHADVEY